MGLKDYIELNRKLKESYRAESESFYHSIRNVREVQEKKILELVKKNASTSFGVKHRFSKIKSIRDFQRAMPIFTYDEYKAHIIKIMDGERNVLTSEPVLSLEPTSGSVAPSKFIPYTISLKEEFRKGIFPWMFDLMQNNPKMNRGSFYWSITPAFHEERKTDGGLSIGFGNDTEYFTEEQRLLISELSAVPFNISKIKDIDRFKRESLSYLISDRNLSFISIWNPTFLSLLLRPLSSQGMELVKCVEDKDRARELMDIFEQNNDESILYSKIWPNLRVISSWTEGNASLYLESLRKIFPQVLIQGKGLISTESFVSFPLMGVTGSALSVNSHFFEFRRDNSSDKTLLAHQLEKEEKYEVIVSTGGGFYRYNLEDVVEVIGFREQCPLLRFLGRSNKVSDIFGEKLNEYHVAGVINRILKDRGVIPSFYFLAPDLKDKKDVHYTLFIELHDKQKGLEGVGQTIDDKLQENYHYKYCRRLGQLDAVHVFQISSSEKLRASDIYLEEQRKSGKKIGNVKPNVLDSGVNWSKVFKGSYVV